MKCCFRKPSIVLKAAKGKEFDEELEIVTKRYAKDFHNANLEVNFKMLSNLMSQSLRDFDIAKIILKHIVDFLVSLSHGEKNCWRK